jgi:transposase-like protein
MLASNGTKDTISFFVRWVRDGSPAVSPAVIMTDRDQAQIGALKIVYPDSRIFLCKWHVLRAMRSHFNANDYPEIWNKVRALVSTPDEEEFNRLWSEISDDPSCPKSFVEYMALYWISDKEKWALVYRKNRSIFEEGDTNMLLEALVIFLSDLSIGC